ncbi:hypothetical protein Peur_058227 [Populus x canadensis]
MVQAQARIFALLSNSALVRGENIADSVTIDKLYIDDTVTPPTAGKLLSNLKMPPSVVNSIPSSQSRAQGRIVAMSGQMTYQPLLSRKSNVLVMGATRNVGVGHGDQNFPGTTFFLASISVVLEFLRLPWRFPDMLLSRNDMVCSEWLSDFWFYLGSCMV